MVRSLMRGLNRAALGVFVINEDRCPCVKLLLDLEDFCRQRDVLDAVVSSFAGHERLDDTAQGFRTEQMMGNHHHSEAPSPGTDGVLCPAGSALLVREVFVNHYGLVCRRETRLCQATTRPVDATPPPLPLPPPT